MLFPTPFSFILFDSSRVIKPLHFFSLVASGEKGKKEMGPAR